MYRFEEDRLYRPTDSELRILATRGTLAIWRHEGRGPKYVRLGGHVLYEGRDLNAYIDERKIAPVDNRQARNLAGVLDRRAGERADAVCA